MLKRFVACIIALFALLASAHISIAGASDHGTVTAADRKAIAKAYAVTDAAFARKDIAAELAYCTPDYRMIDQNDQVIPLADLAEVQRRELIGIRRATCRTHIISMTEKDERIVVLTEQRASLTAVQPGSTAYTTIVDRQTSKDVWRHTPHGWRVELTLVITDTPTMNTTPDNAEQYST